MTDYPYECRECGTPRQYPGRCPQCAEYRESYIDGFCRWCGPYRDCDCR